MSGVVRKAGPDTNSSEVLMKRGILVAIVLAVLPMAAFAEVGIGGAAYFKSPYLLGQSVSKSDLNVNQFTFGGDARLRLSLLQGEALALYSAGDIQSLNIYLDGGVALDVLMFRLSAGIGPNFIYNFGESSPLQAGWNAKVAADLKLGKLSVGLSYIMQMGDGFDVNTSSGLLGAQVLIWQ
jgi:hypothetical protein